jgi:hypothetical protein
LITGFNTDVRHNDRVYHIQTEDKGIQNPFIESLVYVGGEILASRKVSYAAHIVAGADEKFIAGLMEHQHRTVIAAIRKGRLDALAGTAAPSSKEMPAPPPVIDPPPPLGEDEEKSLDQVILDYLASEAEREHLELVIESAIEFTAGLPVELRVCTRKSISQQPIASANVEVKVISTSEPPRVLFRGRTGDDGTIAIRCAIPTFRDGTAAVIVAAQSSMGNDEIKQLIKRRK